MKIGVLGTGDVGRVLGAGFARRGYSVMIGTRDPDAARIREWVHATGNDCMAGTFADAAKFGEVLVLALGWDHVRRVIDLVGTSSFNGKVVLDATNPIAFTVDGEPPSLVLGHDDSAGEQIQRWLPAARVVKAFNSVGHQHMVDPEFGGDRPDMFICGNDPGAKEVADQLIQALGWPPVIDLGGIARSRYLEPLAMVWITHLFNNSFNGNHAFKLLRK